MGSLVGQGSPVPRGGPPASKYFELRGAPCRGGSALVARDVSPDRWVIESPLTLTLFAGAGTEKSTLASVVGPAERFHIVREANGNKRIDAHGQPVRVGTAALAWPYHGGPTDAALYNIDALMEWMGQYFATVAPPDISQIGIGRSFGGTALLEYALRHDGALRAVVAVSPYTPAWTGYVLRTLAGLGRNFNLAGWEWILHLDGMIPRTDTSPCTSERLAALSALYGGMSVADYWAQVRETSQWTFPRELDTRLAQLRAVDPCVDALWNQDWRRLGAADRAGLERQAGALRERAGLSGHATAITILFGERDDQYPTADFPVTTKELAVRAFWQACAVAFGVQIMGVDAGHDLLGGSTASREAVEYVYGLIRSTVDA